MSNTLVMSAFLACCLAVVPVLSSVSASPSCIRVPAVIACWPMHAMCKAVDYRSENDFKSPICQFRVSFFPTVITFACWMYTSAQTLLVDIVNLAENHFQMKVYRIQHDFYQAMLLGQMTPCRFYQPCFLLFAQWTAEPLCAKNLSPLPSWTTVQLTAGMNTHCKKCL